MNDIWYRELDENIKLFFENISDKKTQYKYLPSIGGVTRNGSKLNLGFSCFALKTFYMTGLWKKLNDQDKKGWVNFINSFQSDNGNFPSNSFIDESYIKEFNNTQNKKVIKNTIKYLLHQVNLMDYEKKEERLKTFIRAESKQAISTLNQVGYANKFEYLDFPKEKDSIKIFLDKLNWNKPWSAGAQFAGLCLFSKTQLREGTAPINELIKYSDFLAKEDTGGYYLKDQPSNKEFINGAMKMISGFDWIDKKIHYPEKLIDFCLKSLPSNDGCDLVDIVYVLYMCTKQTEYRKKEIIKYFDKITSLIHIHYHESYYGFSYYMNNSQTHYYGVNITKGQSFPDIHGTTLLIWALSMIFEINEINSVNWKTLKP